MPIKEYIEKNFPSQADFALACGVLPQQVTKWISMGCIVLNGKMYSPRRDVP
ncbi:hypothetical protein ESA_03065 [Cronobacter sakazakii ATCC BAA-894]|uniref:Uncharacterized protein n=1 Tax=Cronobacter sakazakii (strain ATCC BAA-894) TaxID=290339 RepID=A7MI71_CROS8|nr:hypothetical protein ESA_03065 [Cronobacter sakazakii ATCC BAA-894]